MNKKYNVLVTSCGGDIGLSIGKILKDLNCKTFGWDISSKNAANFIFDHFNVCRKVNDKKYISELKNFSLVNKIDIIIPVSEPELRFYTENELIIEKLLPSRVLISNSYSRKIGFDKERTSLFLKEKNLPFPKIYKITNKKEIKFPVIAKPRTGAGSSNIFVLNNFDEMQFISKKFNDLIFQEYLDDSLGEYTCCVFRSSKKELRKIIFKRELTPGGYSGYGEVIESDKINSLLINISESLNLTGSINIQLRIHKGEPVVFEINPRFSSTILFRHLVGFKDLLWSIEDEFNIKISKYSRAIEGTKFYKGFTEYIEL